MKFVAVITLAFGFTYGLPDIFAARNLPKDQTPLALEFPLQSGSYSVVHGGNSEALNHHHRIGSQRFALDIVKLGPWGTRAQGIAPQNLERYYIFEENLYAPCSGEVLAVANDFKDQAPFQSDPENPAGNHIVLYCGEASVLLAHLKQGSITLQPGDSVEAGDLVGQVGNSGNTSEPHLHIQAVKGRIAGIGEHVQGSQALPITFNGKFLSRGSVVQN